jgi:capsular polysaccharide transport system permease protein
MKDDAPQGMGQTAGRRRRAAPLQVVEAPQSPPPRLVKPARAKRRHRLALTSFILLVAAPITAVFVYLYGCAADQYASYSAFSVRKQDFNTAMSLFGGLTNLSSGASDIEVIHEFIQSQDLVKKLDAELDLRKRFSLRQKSDPVFGLIPDASTEELVRYWNRMVSPQLNSSNGILSLETHAFSPQDAQDINTAILRESSDLVEHLSQIAQEDAIRQARDELTLATARLKTARIALATFRKQERIIDPNADYQSQMGLMAQLQQSLAEVLIERDLLEGTPDKDPRKANADRKIAAIRNRIEAERKQVASDGDSERSKQLYSTVGIYEGLLVDQEFAEKTYTSALSAVDEAQAEAKRKSRYLAVHILPGIAQTPEYPRRVILGTMFSVLAFFTWVLLILVAYSLRDRR